jgi:hypothetical protein
MRALTRTSPVLLALLVTACGGSSSPAAAPRSSAPAPTAAPVASAALPSCPKPAGFVLDAARSGPLTPGEYSPSQDVQAALVFDKLQRGERSVFTRLKAPAGGDLVVQCNVLEFPTAADARRFALSFQDLRAHATTVAHALPAPQVPGSALTVAYREEQQSFQGYGIASTQVIEAGALTGTRFVTVSVAGPRSAVGTAETLLKGLSA